VHGFWSVQELADRLTDCGEVARGGCFVAGYFSVTTSNIPSEGQRRARPSMTRRCISDSPLSHRFNFPPVTNRALYYNGETPALKILYPVATATELNTLK
jgi:hypothetical protein